MNNFGKSNVIFVVLIPLFLVLALIVVDTVVSYSENKAFKENTEEIIKTVIRDEEIDYSEYSEEIKKEYERRGYETDSLVVVANSYEVRVENEHNYFGIFSSLKKSFREPTNIKIFGITFKAKENSKAFIKVVAKYNYDNEIKFNYEK